jgi:hypothetical protein
MAEGSSGDETKNERHRITLVTLDSILRRFAV